MEEVCCLLVSSINPPYFSIEDQQKRLKNYELGLLKLFEKKYNFDYYFVDNTVNKELLDNRIADILNKNYCAFIYSNSNNYGKYNKGAGVIETLKCLIEIIKKYKWVVYFEPRQILINHDFFEIFIKNKTNLFTINKNLFAPPHFNTGLFCINSEILLKFISQFNDNDLAEMVKKSISVEYVLYDFFIKNDIFFEKLDKMNLVWNDYKNNKWIEM